MITHDDVSYDETQWVELMHVTWPRLFAPSGITCYIVWEFQVYSVVFMTRMRVVLHFTFNKSFLRIHTMWGFLS